MEYSYQAKSADGKLFTGKVEAASEDEAVTVLHSRGLVILSLVKERALGRDIGSFFSRISNRDQAEFTRQLATLVDADVPFVDSLNTLARQAASQALKKILLRIASEVEAGATFSNALLNHTDIFSNFYISLVRSGEASGKLHEVLLYLADYLERAQDLKAKTKGALSYPVFVLAALIGVTMFLMITVIPQLLNVLKEAGVQDLPFTTKLLIALSGFVNKFFWLIIILILLVVVFLTRYLKTPGGKEVFDRLLIKVPIIGPVVKGIYLSRLSESLATLIKSGVPILEALRITSEVVGNSIYTKILSEARETVSTGGTTSSVLAKYPEIPPLVYQMILIGEKTGKIDFMLEHLAKFYKSRSETTLQSLSTLIEPILVLLIGVGVAILVASILLPIYNLVGAG